MKAAICLCIACVCLCATSRAQDLSTVELSSEDEIYEAFLSGEIDYDQFTQLLEMVQDGLDSTNVHLLDLIPDILFPRLEDSAALFAAAQDVQQTRIKYTYYQSAQEPYQSRYSTNISSRLSHQWATDFRFRRDMSGAERLTGRSASYRGDTGLVRELSLGNFSKRLGLGTIVGHHSKLMKCEREFSGENIAFPDYSGQNGLYATLAFGKVAFAPLVSFRRDSAQRLVTGGANLSVAHKAVTGSVIFGYTNLHNRSTGSSLSDYKVALNASKSSKDAHWAIEYVGQGGFRSEFGTAVFEAVHRLSAAKLQATAWLYGDNYLDLTGGSKTAALPQTSLIPGLDFSYSDKRSGQKGGMVRADLGLSQRIQWSNSLLVATRGHDTSTAQWLTEWEYRQSGKLAVSLLALYKQNERAPTEKVEQRIRAGVKYSSGNFVWRAYVGHTSRNLTSDYFFWLSDARFAIAPDTKLQLWSNLGRLVNGSVDYWYVFARTEHRLFDQVRFSTKLMHRYDHTAYHHHQSAIGLEVSAAL